MINKTLVTILHIFILLLMFIGVTLLLTGFSGQSNLGVVEELKIKLKLICYGWTLCCLSYYTDKLFDNFEFYSSSYLIDLLDLFKNIIRGLKS